MTSTAEPVIKSWAEFLTEFPHPTLRDLVEYRWGSQTALVDALLNGRVERSEESWVIERVMGGGMYFCGLQIINRKIDVLKDKLDALLILV